MQRGRRGERGKGSEGGREGCRVRTVDFRERAEGSTGKLDHTRILQQHSTTEAHEPNSNTRNETLISNHPHHSPPPTLHLSTFINFSFISIPELKCAGGGRDTCTTGHVLSPHPPPSVHPPSHDTPIKEMVIATDVTLTGQ